MNPFLINVSPIILILTIWAIPWKVYAVWTAAQRKEKAWFVSLIILNTFAILEIYYIFWIAKKNWTEVKDSFLNALPDNHKKSGHHGEHHNEEN